MGVSLKVRSKIRRRFKVSFRVYFCVHFGLNKKIPFFEPRPEVMIEILNAEAKAGEVQMLWPITLCALDIIGRVLQK